MTFNTYGDKGKPSLLLIPGLGVSYEIFLPLINILKDRFHMVAAGIDGFLLFIAVPMVFWSIVPIAIVAGAATFAAIQEGHFIRTGPVEL